MTETAEAIQERLERNREEYQSQKDREPSGLSDAVTSEAVDVVCVDCEEDFTTVATLLGGKKIHATRCSVCHERDDEQRSPTVKVDIVAALEGAGFNVRKHGTLEMTALDEGLAERLAVFAGDALNASVSDAVESVYLFGPTGTGKTQAMASLARDLLSRGYPAKRIVFDRARALITTIQDRYGKGSVDDVIAKRRNAGVWLLDDVGTEKLTADAFRIIEDILDARDGHPMVWSSNINPNELVEKWAAVAETSRFRSRMSTFGFFHVSGDDRRFL